MKSFAKQNSLFLVTTIIAIISFFVLIYFSLQFSSRTEELLKKIDQVENDIQDLNADKTYYAYVPSDYAIIKSDLTHLSSIEKDLSNFANYLVNEKENVSEKWMAKSAESVNAALTRLFSRLRKKCRDSFITLPSSSAASPSSSIFQSEKQEKADETFGFSFTSYDGFWPSFSVTEARKLGTQSEIINELIDHLSVCTDANHSIDIISIKREIVGEVDRANIGSDALDLSGISSLLLRNLKEIESYAFKISLKTQTIPLRKLLNKLRPPFLLREILIYPAEENQSNNFDQSTFSPDPFATNVKPENKFVPIVSKVDSRIDLVLEYILESKRDLTDIISLLAKHEDPHSEVLYDWLEKSGHQNLLKEAQIILNEAGVR